MFNKKVHISAMQFSDYETLPLIYKNSCFYMKNGLSINQMSDIRDNGVHVSHQSSHDSH